MIVKLLENEPKKIKYCIFKVLLVLCEYFIGLHKCKVDGEKNLVVLFLGEGISMKHHSEHFKEIAKVFMFIIPFFKRFVAYPFQES